MLLEIKVAIPVEISGFCGFKYVDSLELQGCSVFRVLEPGNVGV